MIDSANLVWDTCVFSRYIIGQPTDFVTDIDLYISDARRSRRTIYFSTIVLAEVRQSAVKQGREARLDQFMSDMNSAFVPIDVNPNIGLLAGRLRAVNPQNPSPVQKKQKSRLLGTGDSIHLATALYLRNSLGLSDIVFHTLDEGKGETWEGRCVPLLGFESYYPPAIRTTQIQAACDLPGEKPFYPQTQLDSDPPKGTPINPTQRNQ